ncbi:GNAT family N-acetyltransferase [Tepidibacter formicigenes]|jgi:predicted acetyltransferase|uniref:Predicted acetyltransferase n=1 Tax=Tepidibacter formicigenes DSM 15518 TaxID=1123349 RepID=A0A1M6LY50_9FIRM|nr:GNAT family N-acetyltransferase [Tepidibacter formicigenes]SHJ76104.1 Predicted acetyltransferase [Tepidibacter formicigenes DSM 15518]
MKVRFAKDEDLKEIKEMWKYCFDDTQGFFNYYFENKYNKENTLVVEIDNNIISSLQLNQYKIVLNNKPYDTSYVVGVSTFPDARGKGAMKIIMKSALNELYKKNQIVSILMPIDYRLYRYFGYEHCCDQIEYNMDIEILKDFKINGNLKKASLEDIPGLIDVYKSFLKDKNGYILRDENYFENLFKEINSEDGYIYIHENEEGPDGYIIYFKMDKTLFVREIAYKNINALKSFLKFIYNHNTQFKKANISSSIDDKIKYLTLNLRNIDIKIKPFMMGRIINFKKFIESLNLNIDANLNLKVEDDFIDENNKVFNINIRKGEIEVLETNENEDLTIDINTLSQLGFSYIDTKEALFLGKINVKSKDRLKDFEKLFTKKINYINEYV